MEIRRIVDKDIPSVVEILNARYCGSYEFIPYTAEIVASELKKKDLVAFVATRSGTVVGTACYASWLWGEDVNWIATLPVGDIAVEDLLFEELEKFVKGDRLKIMLEDHDNEIVRWLGRGFKVEDGVHHMVAPLTEPIPMPPYDSTITLRSLYKGEVAELVSLVNAAFEWNRLNAGALNEWKGEDPCFDESWINVAEIEGKIVSAIVSKKDVEYSSHFGKLRGYLGPASTLPGFRKLGLASLLTIRAMNFLLEKGMGSVALYTHDHNKASLSLLKKLGFTTRNHWKQLQKHYSSHTATAQP